jgi:hypothetical protein
MSVTLFANLPEHAIPTKKVRMVDLYPNLDNSDFDIDQDIYKYEKDEQGFYVDTIVDPDFHNEVNFCNDNFEGLLSLIDRNLSISSKVDGNCGDIEAADVPSFLHKVIKARNSNMNRAVQPDVHDHNFYHMGLSSDRIARSLTHIMQVCQTAIKHNVGITWG